MDALLQDIRYAFRSLRRSPSVAVAALLTLALGIGANTAIFSVIDAVLLRPLPYPHADRIVAIWERRPTGQPNSMTTLNYLDYASQSHVFEKIAAATNCCSVMTLAEGGPPTLVGPGHVSAGYFDIFGIAPAIGRTFLPGEDTTGRDHVVVISHRLWASRFGSDPTIAGRAIHLDGEAYTVVGVLPAAPFDRMLPLIWLPLTFTPANTSRNSHWLISGSGAAVALLKPGVTISQARTDMDAIARRIAADHPDTNKDWGVIVNPYATEVVGADLERSLALLLSGVAGVLLIGCANLANLMLARGLARRREFAVRLALGAPAARLIRHALTEGAIVSLTGGALGLITGAAATRTLFNAIVALPVAYDIASKPVPPEAVTGVDARVLLFSFGLSVACGLIFSVIPAVRSIRDARAETLTAGSRTSATRAQSRLRSALVIVEVAFACVLLISASLLARSFFNMVRADTGFDGTNVVTAVMPIRAHRFSSADDFLAFIRLVRARLEALPGVQDVAFANAQPTHGPGSGTFVQVVGQPYEVRAQRPVASFDIVSASYFRAMGLHLRRGRVLSEDDSEGQPPVAVINETMARLFFGQEDPLHRTLLMDDSSYGNITVRSEAPYEVVGIVGDEQVSPFDDPRPHPLVYVSIEQKPSDAADIVVVRTAADPSGMEPALRRAVASVDSDQALSNVKTVAQLKADTVTPDRFRSTLLASFAIIALLLAAVGIYGVMSYSVRQRQQELGIRAALGATPRNLVGLVIRGGMRLTLIGVGIGSAAALGAGRLLAAFLFGVSPHDAWTVLSTAGVLAAVAAFACYIPARRAAHVNPLEALRAE